MAGAILGPVVSQIQAGLGVPQSQAGLIITTHGLPRSHEPAYRGTHRSHRTAETVHRRLVRLRRRRRRRTRRRLVHDSASLTSGAWYRRRLRLYGFNSSHLQSVHGRPQGPRDGPPREREQPRCRRLAANRWRVGDTLMAYAVRGLRAPAWASRAIHSS